MKTVLVILFLFILWGCGNEKSSYKELNPSVPDNVQMLALSAYECGYDQAVLDYTRAINSRKNFLDYYKLKAQQQSNKYAKEIFGSSK